MPFLFRDNFGVPWVEFAVDAVEKLDSDREISDQSGLKFFHFNTSRNLFENISMTSGF